MAGLLDDPSNPGPSDPGALYGNLLSQQQRQALAYRGLLAAAGALGQAAMPSRLPVPLGAALGSAAGAIGGAQDTAALNAMRGNLLGLQGQQLAWRMGMANQLMQQLGNVTGQGSPSPQGAPAAAPGQVPGASPIPTAPTLQHAFWQIESGGSLNPPDSKAGAIGPMQIMPATGAQYGATPQQLRDPNTNLAIGGAYIGDLSKRYGNDPDAIAIAYNAGPQTADKWLANGRDNGMLPAETQKYLDKLHLILPQSASAGGALPGVPDMSGAMRTVALSDLAGFPTLGQAVMNSPQWQAANAAAKAQATLPAQYAAPGANPALQQQLAAAKARGEYAGPGADVNLQSQLATAKAQAQFAGPAGVGTLRQGGTAFNKQTGQPVYAAPYIREVVDPATGQTHYQWDYPPGAPNAPGAGPTGAQGNLVTGMPSPSAAAQGAPAASAAAGNAQLGNQPLGPLAKLSPQRVEEMKGVGEEAAKTREEIIDEANAAQAQQANLQTMKSDAAKFYVGPFADHAQQANALLRLINPTDARNMAVASYEDFNKSAGQLIRSTVREQSSRAAVQEFKLITQQLPNAEMSPQGLGYVIDDLMGINDYRIAKAQAQHAWEQRPGSQGPGDVSGFETDWQKQVSPYAFMFARMDPARRQAIISTVAKQPGGTAELSHLAQQIKYAQQYEQFIQ